MKTSDILQHTTAITAHSAAHGSHRNWHCLCLLTTLPNSIILLDLQGERAENNKSSSRNVGAHLESQPGACCRRIKFSESLGYMTRLCLKKTNTPTNQPSARDVAQ